MTDTSNTHEGGCACGRCRYRMDSDPIYVHCCHCTWCQRETGASYALNAMIEADRVTVLKGSPEAVLTPSESGQGQKIWRCPHCQVALWGNYAGAGDKIHFIRVGTLDEAGRFPPDAHIFTATKQPWVVIPEGEASYDVFYAREEVWPDEALQRRSRVLEPVDSFYPSG